MFGKVFFEERNGNSEWDKKRQTWRKEIFEAYLGTIKSGEHKSVTYKPKLHVLDNNGSTVLVKLPLKIIFNEFFRGGLFSMMISKFKSFLDCTGKTAL